MSTANEWSEWIEHKPGDPCPIAWAKRGEFEYACGSVAAGASLGEATTYEWGWANTLTRYRYLLSAAPKEQPRWTDMAPGDPAPVQMIEVGIGTLWSDGEPLWYPDATVKHVPWDIEEDLIRIIGYSFNKEFVLAERRKFLDQCKANVADQPTAAEVEATQKPEQDTERDRQEDEANAGMVERDFRPPSERERRYQMRKAIEGIDWPRFEDEPEGLTVVAPVGQRVGSGWWGL